MSFSSGENRKRPGIFDSFRAAMTPAPLPEDDGRPIPPPRTVNIATALCLIGGLIFAFVGIYALTITNSYIDDAVSQYSADVASCQTNYGGIGDAVVVADSAADDVKAKADNCKQLVQLTPDLVDGARSRWIVTYAITSVIGALAIVGGWFLRSGARWARFMVLGGVLLSVILTMLFQSSSLYTLVASLLMVVAVMLSFIGKGGVYFARMRGRRANS
jgi:hypothetical protein